MTGLVRAALARAGAAHGRVTALRRAAYRSGLLRVQHAPVPVVSVGALCAGGSGKTPVARWIAHTLLELGALPGVVCGGYRGSRRRAVTLLAPELTAHPAAVERYGDEAVMLARSSALRDALVVCGGDRVAAARRAASAGADVVVLDDGFQHCRLHRDLDIVLIGGGPLPAPLPAGPGREGPEALTAADLVWRHDREGRSPTPGGGGEGVADAEVEVEADVVSRYVATGLSDVRGRSVAPLEQLRGCAVFMLAGIAGPAAFRAVIRAAGARIVGQVVVGDHQAFSARQLRRAVRAGADLILCTEKDAARVADGPLARALTVLNVEVALERGEGDLRRALRRVMAGGRTDRPRREDEERC